MITETPLNLKDETIEQIKALQRANLDAADALREASDQVEAQMLDEVFTRMAQMREANADELAAYVALNDGEPADANSLGGTLRSAWVRFRGALNGGDSEVLLIEARRSEAALDAAYRDVIMETTGSPLNDVLHRQLAAVLEARKLIEELEDLAAA